MFARPQVDLELQRVEAPSWATPGATVYALLPSLDVLVGEPGFGLQDPIHVPGSRPPFDPFAFFNGNLH
jgi:hypothetical protein